MEVILESTQVLHSFPVEIVYVSPCVRATPYETDFIRCRRKMVSGYVVDERSLIPFYQHQWLYMRDTVGDWCEARVIQMEETMDILKIHFVGYNEKYDEVLSLASTVSHRRLASIMHPFSSDSTPVRGPRDVEWSNSFTVGMRLDVLDFADKWLEAKVKDVKYFRDGPMVLVNFVGWHPKYDDWIPIESYRLAPLHTRTPRPPRNVGPIG
jgi:hypothetical protein